MQKIKELEAALEKLPGGTGADRQRVDLLNQLAYRYVNVDSKKALELALESQRLARAAQHGPGLAGGLWVEGICHHWHGDYTLSIARGQEALKLAEESRDPAGQANAHNVIGMSLLKLGEHAQALIHHLKSLKLWQEVNDPHGLATIYNNLGADYTIIADYTKALEYFNRSLKLKQQADDQMGEASTLMNIGGIYQSMEKHQEALEYYHESQKLFEEAGDARSGFVLNNIGGIYEKLREFQNALNCYQKSLKLAQQQGYRQAEATVLTNIGTVLTDLGQPAQAEDHYRRSLAIAEEIHEQHNIAENLIALGGLCARDRAFQDCARMLERGMAIAEQIKAGALLSKAYQAMSDVHRQWQQYRPALEYYEKHVAIERQMLNESSQQQLQNLMAQCEVSKFQKEVEFFRHKSEELARANAELGELNARLKTAHEEKDFLLRKLEEQNKVLEGMVTEDPQSGLYNRRTLHEKIHQEIARARRYRTPLTVAMAEIDGYPALANKLPAPKLELVIKALSRILRENLRLVDVVGRYDNHTFVFAFPEAGRAKALAICERLQKLIVHHDWKRIDSALALTVSIGLTDEDKTDDPYRRILEAKFKLAQAEGKGPGRIAS
ncbi:MAG TPA: tetratricopeptide repeat protein [Candidatus Edwardsbacteria bacterium]|nr:tetratricopeptide repeat protein [Candidatus Edwardsbacteria bacterium]